MSVHRAIATQYQLQGTNSENKRYSECILEGNAGLNQGFWHRGRHVYNVNQICRLSASTRKKNVRLKYPFAAPSCVALALLIPKQRRKS